MELRTGETIERELLPWPLGTILIYIFTVGLWEIWRRRHRIMLTNQRLVFEHGIVLFRRERSLPLDRLQDATYTRTFWLGGVKSSTAGGSGGDVTDRALYRPKRTKEFIRALNDTIHAHQHRGV